MLIRIHSTTVWVPLAGKRVHGIELDAQLFKVCSRNLELAGGKANGTCIAVHWLGIGARGGTSNKRRVKRINGVLCQRGFCSGPRSSVLGGVGVEWDGAQRPSRNP